jgi:hypothetical protein
MPGMHLSKGTRSYELKIADMVKFNAFIIYLAIRYMDVNVWPVTGYFSNVSVKLAA